MKGRCLTGRQLKRAWSQAGSQWHLDAALDYMHTNDFITIVKMPCCGAVSSACSRMLGSAHSPVVHAALPRARTAASQSIARSIHTERNQSDHGWISLCLPVGTVPSQWREARAICVSISSALLVTALPVPTAQLSYMCVRICVSLCL